MTKLPVGSRCLLDTNILLRLTQAVHLYPAQHRAVHTLLRAGTQLFMTPQNVAELWNVSTRPDPANGWGLTVEQTQHNVLSLEQRIRLVPENLGSYRHWLGLVTDLRVSGRQVHDARLAAAMLEHDIPYLLTSNARDFRRYPFIQLLDPEHWEA